MKLLAAADALLSMSGHRRQQVWDASALRSTPELLHDAPFDEEDDNDRRSVSLGWFFHALMSTKARIGWFLSTAYRSLVSSGPQPKKLSFERQDTAVAVIRDDYWDVPEDPGQADSAGAKTDRRGLTG